MKAAIGIATLGGGLMWAGLAAAQAPAEAPSVAPTVVVDPDAPVGKQAGTLMLRLRAIGVIPQNFSSQINVIGGSVGTTASAAPELDLSYFFTDHIAAELIAASTRHVVTASNTAIGDFDVGSVWVLPPTITLQYHFMPHERFSPYIGAGLNLTFFYASHAANPALSKVGFSNNAGAAIQAGFDYNLTGHWFLNFDIKQIFVTTEARITTVGGASIKASTALNPTVIGGGIGYRF